ncbi:MAG: hypothetical protein J2P21_21700 [Chloracidobacterium sp.]|nr:hypothetical protein [Chloracidobacterium sp.]
MRSRPRGGSADELFALRDGRWNSIEVPGSAPVNGLVRAPDGVFWLGASDGLLCWDGASTCQKFTTANSGQLIRRVACDRSGALWIATATRSEKPVDGLARFYQGKWTVYSRQMALAGTASVGRVSR